MKVSIIAAIDEKRGLGKDNKMMWHIKDDLVHLKNLTKDKIVVLGRKTYESMIFYYDKSGRPLPGKIYIVITRDQNYKPTRDNVIVANSLEEALSKYPDDEIFITGGGEIFRQAMEKNLVDRLYLTLVEGNYDADTFFPDYSMFDKIINRESREENGIKFEYLDLEK